MRLTFVQPRPELRPYIESFWVFESAAGLPTADVSVAVPNGCSKLIIPYLNSVWRRHLDDSPKETKEHGLYFVGVQEGPILLTSAPRATGLIVIEFRPHGAYPFLNLCMAETTSRCFLFEELRGPLGLEMQRALRNLVGVGPKIHFVQTCLADLVRSNPRSPDVVGYAVGRLKAAGGRFPIQALEQETGCSRRPMERLFKEHVGVPPKVLARIFRFQRFYTKWSQGQPYDMWTRDLYDYYHDESHFAKEFKEFSGYSPWCFTSRVRNQFGRRLALG